MLFSNRCKKEDHRLTEPFNLSGSESIFRFLIGSPRGGVQIHPLGGCRCVIVRTVLELIGSYMADTKMARALAMLCLVSSVTSKSAQRGLKVRWHGFCHCPLSFVLLFCFFFLSFRNSYLLIFVYYYYCITGIIIGLYFFCFVVLSFVFDFALVLSACSYFCFIVSVFGLFWVFCSLFFVCLCLYFSQRIGRFFLFVSS